MFHVARLSSLLCIVFLIAAAAGTFAWAAPAPTARVVPHFERAAGTLDTLEPTTLFFSGIGYGTHIGRYEQVGSNDFDDQGNVLNGAFNTTAADGSTLSGTYDGTYSVLDDGRIRFDVHVLWLEGTGRFEGVTGEGDVVAILDGLFEGAGFEYVTRAVLIYP